MPFSKTTTRAFAASVALVAAGSTVAGAAVFHLPILGFGSTAVASATVTPTTAHHTRVAPRHKVKPRVVVKIWYVDDIVHRRAPAPAPVYTQPPAAAASVALVSAPMPAAALPASIAPPPVVRVSTTTAAPHTDAGHVEQEHEDGAPPTASAHHAVTPTAGGATALQAADR